MPLVQHLLGVLWHLPAAEAWGRAEGQGQDNTALPPAHPLSFPQHVAHSLSEPRVASLCLKALRGFSFRKLA